MDYRSPLGEIAGAEERYDVLIDRMKECGLVPEDYWWYLELRQYGTVPHSEFGLGLERTVQLVTGMTNIRDCIPFHELQKRRILISFRETSASFPASLRGSPTLTLLRLPRLSRRRRWLQGVTTGFAPRFSCQQIPVEPRQDVGTKRDPSFNDRSAVRPSGVVT